MSVTVADLLKLPSLRQAKVIAGHGGLNRTVSSVSVLESTNPGVLIDEVFPQGEYFSSEIVITGFLNMLDNVDLQYRNIERLAEGGEVGLILFYVGVYLKEIHPRLIQFANERDFVLIVMPEGDVTLRYGEVISDAMELIFRDRDRNPSLVCEILERASILPRHQQTVSTILKMLSDQLGASLILCDSSLQIQHLAAWPRNAGPQVKKILDEPNALPGDQQSTPCSLFPDSRLYRFTIRPDRGQTLHLFLLREGVQPSQALLAQLPDVVRLGINIWGQDPGEIAIHELIRAILQDEPLKMRQLANIFHINVSDIHEMWILRCEREQQGRFQREGIPLIREHLKHYCRTVVADLYEGDAVAFMDWIERTPDRPAILQELLNRLESLDFQIALAQFHPLSSTSDVRRAFLLHHEALETALSIWPKRSCYTLQEMEFASGCRRFLEKGEDALSGILTILEPLKEASEDNSLLRTLEIYLLDAESSLTRCADFLFLHKNTVKYRLNRIRELLGIRFDKAPELFILYRCVALHRLTSSRR